MEAFSFLQALPEDFVNQFSEFETGSIGKDVCFYHENEIDDWSKFNLAIVSVAHFEEKECPNPDFYLHIREQLYKLYKANWKKEVIDLGNIPAGNSITDTFYVLQEVQRELLRKQITLLIIGGRQDLTYAQYRAYDNFKYMVNLVGIDAKFDIGDAEKPISNQSYVSHMIVNKPYNLFNFSNIGYQTYYVKQDEKDLVEKLFFEAYRLGEATSQLPTMEPILRDADLVSLDLNSIKASEVISNKHKLVNGFESKELCALARYSGLSYKNSSFGIYNAHKFENINAISQIAAQILWYYIEGAHYQVNENPSKSLKEFILYKVPINEDVLFFYESENTGKWWVQIPQFDNKRNKLTEVSFLPCNRNDYLTACDQTYPERWLRAKYKNEL